MIKVVFFATPKIALKSLDYLVKSTKIEVLAIVTQPDKPTGRGHKVLPPPVKEYAIEHNIPFFQPDSIKKDLEIQEKLKQLEPDFFVTFAFGQILSKEVLAIPKYATINLHASLLPLYRGANPIQRAIINGDKKTGICTMVTEEGLDCGGICLKDEIEITENMNYEELFELIAQKAPELIELTLLNIKSGAVKLTTQCHEKATYAHKLKKEDAQIDWNKSAREIHNLVRGLYKAPSAHCFFKGKTIKIMETRVADDEVPKGFLGEAGEITRVCKEGIEVATLKGILLITKVKPEGKGEMFARDWVNGAKISIGDGFK
ncbi:MAG: methionyl-tRNA formyltransferase [Candidatus Gastranaerophilales bacterium]|nr:methionyl-tRNA formyltransferase [Candidatus Gastranaerophilales bacterium]